MNRKEVYEQTKSFLKDRWISVFTVNAIVYFVTQIITSILVSMFFGNALTRVLNDFYLNNGVNADELMNVLTGYAILGILAGIIGSAITAALSMTLLDAYRHNKTISAQKVWVTLKNYFSSIIVVVIIVSFINALMMTLPYVQMISPLISIFITLFTSFAYFIIYDDETDGITALKRSFKETRGYRLDVFLINLHYSVIIFLGTLVVIIGLAIFVGGALAEFIGPVVFGLIVMLGGAFLAMYLKIKYTPYLTVAPVIYYENKNK